MRIATAIRSLILAAAVSAIPAASFAGVFVSVSFGAPPVLPVYVQPSARRRLYLDPRLLGLWRRGRLLLGAGHLGAAALVGALWTPGYWGWGDGGYRWHAGYWGPHVGFYGGVNYGFGYFGVGFVGGCWDAAASATTAESTT